MNGRFYSASEYYKAVFGEKVYRLSLCLGTTCPNRDGAKDTRGCIFCSEGSSHFAEGGNDVKSQIENAKLRIQSKTDAQKFIAYFQSYTTTYLPIEVLRKAFFMLPVYLKLWLYLLQQDPTACLTKYSLCYPN